jgi:hypothetical protein
MKLRTALRRKAPKEIHCHEMVREVAEAMAHELYADAMRDNNIYDAWKAACPELTPALCEAKFVELLVPLLVKNGAARATLARTLTSNINDDLKARVYEALVLDSHLSRGRRRMRVQGAVASIH